MNPKHREELEALIDREISQQNSDDDIDWAWPYIVGLGDAVVSSDEWITICQKALRSIQNEQIRRIIKYFEDKSYDVTAAMIRDRFMN